MLQFPVQQHSFSVWSVLILLLTTRPLFAEENAFDSIDRRRNDAALVSHFESKIRPVLIKHCYECHSREAGESKGGLLLDSRNGWVTGGDSGPSIVVGQPAESIMLEALRYEGMEMPPDGRLPDNILRDFEQWIADGAVDPREDEPKHAAPEPQEIDTAQRKGFWSFQPLQPRATPVVENQLWPFTKVDRFILAKLEQQGLEPVADATDEQLVRRLYFDLIGLPPSVRQQDDFLRAARVDRGLALERLVSTLLESPHFGEHWGRHWLDVARYADSNGNDFNATFHNAWRYRNYVIDAFNEDKAFNQFVKEQIAGDLLRYESDQERTEQLIATGFLMLGAKMLSERDKAKLTMDVVDEQIDTVGKAFMGLTLGCARCHAHKFDPIPTEDYYALAGIFKSTITLEGEIQKYVSDWTTTELPVSDELKKSWQEFRAEKKRLEKSLKEMDAQIDSTKKSMQQVATTNLGILVDDAQATTTGQWKHSMLVKGFVGDGYIHDNGENGMIKTVEFRPHLPAAGEYEIRFAFNAGSNRSSVVPITIKHANGADRQVVSQRMTPEIDGRFQPLGRYRFEKGTAGSVLISNAGADGYVIVDAVQFVPAADLDLAESEFVSTDDTTFTKPSEALLAKANKLESAKKRLQEEMKELEARSPAPIPSAMAVEDAAEIADCAICIRGEVENEGQVVPRGFLRVASRGSTAIQDATQSGRLELAEWLASDEHPLTARIIVNRVWLHMLGSGIVKTPDSFGYLGAKPTHPELLDQLTLDFIKSGWSIKSLIRRIASSHVYQLSSRSSGEALAKDPTNDLYWRAHRKRIPAEAIRDSMLTMSGMLEKTRGASPVSRFAKLVSTNKPEDDSSKAEESYRRSVYLAIIRGDLPPILTTFDFADPDLVTGRRPTTTGPTQALLMMNDPFVAKCAAALASQLCDTESEKTDQDRVEKSYRMILARQATPDEIRGSMEFVESCRISFALDEEQVWKNFVHALFASTEFRFLD